MEKLLILAVSVLFAVSAAVSDAGAWLKKKDFEKMGFKNMQKLSIDPASCADNYLKVRGAQAKKAIVLRGTKSTVKFPWAQMKDESRLYTIGMLMTNAQEIYLYQDLRRKMLLHGVAELTAKDCVLDLLEDVQEGLAYMGADAALLDSVKELSQKVKEEPDDAKEANPETKARFDALSSGIYEFVVKDIGSSYVSFVDFGSWISYLRMYSRSVPKYSESGNKEGVEQYTKLTIGMMKYYSTYAGLCETFSLPGAVTKNIKVIGDIYQDINDKKKELLPYAAKIADAADNIEVSLLTT